MVQTQINAVQILQIKQCFVYKNNGIDKVKTIGNLKKIDGFNKAIDTMVQAIFNGNKCKFAQKNKRYLRTQEILINYCINIIFDDIEKYFKQKENNNMVQDNNMDMNDNDHFDFDDLF